MLDGPEPNCFDPNQELGEVIVVVEVEFAKRRHAVSLLLIRPMQIDDSEGVVNCAGEGERRLPKCIARKCSGLEHMHGTDAPSSSYGIVVVGSFQFVFLDSISALKGEEWAVDSGTGTNVTRFIIDHSASRSEERRKTLELLGGKC